MYIIQGERYVRSAKGARMQGRGWKGLLEAYTGGKGGKACYRGVYRGRGREGLL